MIRMMLRLVQPKGKYTLPRCYPFSSNEFTVEACTSRTLPDSKSAILLPPSHKSKKMLQRKRDTSQSHTKGPFFRAGSDNDVLQC